VELEGHEPVRFLLASTSERALEIDAADLLNIQGIAAHYENPNYPLPVVGQNITHNHVNALAAITYFEGRVRPLARNRRRSAKQRPERFAPENYNRATGL